MNTPELNYLGKAHNTLRETAIAVGLIGTLLDIAHMSNYPVSRQQLINIIGPIGRHIGNFSCSYLASIVGTLILPQLIEGDLDITPSGFREVMTIERNAVLFGVLIPLAGNVIAEYQIFLGSNIMEHTGDIAMGALAIGLGVLSSRIIYKWLADVSVAIGKSKV